MEIGGRLRALRGEKKLSQGDIQKRSGLLRCYISRVENGYTTPTIDTLEKMARAMEVPLYRVFYDGEAPPKLSVPPRRKAGDGTAWGYSGKDARVLNQFRSLLGRMDARETKLLFSMAQQMASKRKKDK